MAVLFDTRAYHRTLTDAGLPEAVADAHTRALEVAMEGGVATRQGLGDVEQKLSRDITDVEHKLSRDIAAVRHDLSQDITAVKQEVTILRKDLELGIRDVKIWTGGVAAAMAGLIIGAIKLF